MNDDFNALELVERVAAKEAAAARAAQLQIVSFCSPQLPKHMKGDVTAFERLLTGLTRNSIAHTTQNGAVMVEILQDLDVRTERVRFGVCDSRTDVGPEQLEQHKQSLLHTEVDGQSLRSVLDRLEAELEYDVRLVGRATRFFISVPLRRAGATTADDYEFSDEMQQAKFFIVANDPYPNRIIQHYIRYHNLTLNGAPSAAEAFDVIATHAGSGHPFDVVMIVPPIEDMTASDIARTLRNSMYVSHTKLLYVAPLDIAEDKLNAMEAGFDGTIGKPFTQVALFDALEQLVGRLPKKAVERPLILIVDDNAINQKVALFQVRRLGFEGVPVDNGLEALDAMSNGTFAAVLMDLQMPKMSGIEAVREIRKRERGSDRRIPIIALSGADSLEEEARSVGCDDFLLKPVRKDRLAKALERVMPKNLLRQAQQCQLH